jgi:hypothetical protein
MESAAITTRRVKGIEGEGKAAFRCQPCFPLSRRGESQTVLLLALGRREGRHGDAGHRVFSFSRSRLLSVLCAAWVDRSCTEEVFKQPGVGRAG